MKVTESIVNSSSNSHIVKLNVICYKILPYLKQHYGVMSKHMFLEKDILIKNVF